MACTRRSMMASLAGAVGSLRGADEPRPNFVILLVDDMGWEQVGFTGGKEVPTPHIDRIAREGTQLTQFYVQPVCTPTRGALLTGRYSWKNGTERRPSTASRQGMLKDERTLAEALRDAGYATWMVGKWHLGEWQTAHLPRSRGFQHHYGFYGALIDSFTHTREGILDWHRNGEPVVEEGYSTFLLAQEASRLIRNHDGSRPFFLYMPFNAVHGPHQAPAEYMKKYEHLGREGPQRAQLHCLDIAVGQVMQALRDKGIEGNTLVWFTNDNGGTRLTSNGPYRDGKSAYHEGGVLTPAAVRWPGKVPAGRKASGLIHVTDIFPTLCALAGADARKGLPLDGVDVWPAIVGGRASARKEIVHSLQVLRMGDWKLIEQGATYYNWPEQPLQLYNLAKDPYEKNNVAAAETAVVEKMRERLRYHKQFARAEEPPERIPDFPPAVYGEEENRKYGAEVRVKLRGIGEKDAKLERKKKKRRN